MPIRRATSRSVHPALLAVTVDEVLEACSLLPSDPGRAAIPPP
ncbi:hypothetical protein [Actinoplanes sp. NBRC 103695]|nr:hypothetical protein [Actinoplanes sp. NBRC 103695]